MYQDVAAHSEGVSLARKTSLSGQSPSVQKFRFLVVVNLLFIYGFGHVLAERLRILSGGT